MTGKRVVIETGHMIDKPGRAEIRFPPEAEARVALAIGKVLDEWRVGKGSIVLSQGARGTDILVAEAALKRGAEVRLLLALPRDHFEARSVQLEDSDWVARFRALVETCPVFEQPTVERPPEGDNPFARNNLRVLQEAFGLASTLGCDVNALAVWDGAAGDGKGGTADFVEHATERGAAVRLLDPRTAWRTPNIPYWERQVPAGSKRMLALDGGGMRSLITVGILKRMEELLGNRPLADYFDYIAGTSTGAIIASLLSKGERINDIQKLYEKLGPAIFKKRFLPARVRSFYKDVAVSAHLKDHLGAKTVLGSDELRTLLLLVTHRVDTDSLWPLSNNTRARYNSRSRKDCNLTLPLSQVVRGSAAAPVYFLPEEIQIGDQRWVFEDGGVTPFNNPAPLLFEMATSPRYKLGWETGTDKLLLVSVGTGFAPAVPDKLKGRKTNLYFQGKSLLRVIMNGSSVENDRLCRVLGHCRHGSPIDGEFDAFDVAGTVVPQPLFSYVRYNADISAKGLAKAGLGDVDPKLVSRLDAVKASDDLIRIGRTAADQVSLSHFAGFTTP